MTATYTPPEEIDQQHEIDSFINVCLDGSHEVHSKNGGDLYCETAGHTVYTPGGWPAPKLAAEERSAARTPRWGRLTLATAEGWLFFAVFHNFKYEPTALRAAHCRRRAPGRYRCNVSWRHGSDAFAGVAEVGKANVYTGAYRYGLRVIRTNARTHQRRTFTVAYGHTAQIDV